MGGGSFALPLLRTEPALRAAPVFRSAYFPKKLFSFFSKTLDLQPLCGLRWAGEASLPLAPHRTSSSSCSGVPVGLFSEKALQLFLQNARPSAAARPPMGGGSFVLPLLRTEMPLQDIPVFRMAYSAPTAHRAVSSETLMLQPRRGLRTPHRPIVSLCFSPKRTTFRFTSLTLRLRTETFFQKVPVFRMAYSAPTAHCAVSSETLMLQVRFAHPPNPAPLSRFFSISRRSGLMAPLCKGSCPASSRTEGLPPG